jgi:hypothetical protein
LQADKIGAGNHYWLRADPVNLRILRDQMVLQPAMTVSMEEATQLCAALNEHFAGDNLHFMAPHPQRWYLRLDTDPGIETAPLTQVLGKNVHDFLPQGREGLRWHGVLNEIQMLLHAHPLNEAREQRGEWQINGMWLWGGGHAAEVLQQPFSHVYTDDVLATAFAAVAGIGHGPLPGNSEWLTAGDGNGADEILVIWTGLQAALQYGDLESWRKSMQQFEQHCAYPLWQALRSGTTKSITLDVPQENSARRFVLTRHDSRKFWRRTRQLADFS